MKHVTNRTWKPEDIEELRRLVEAGASPVKAAARFKRSVVAVQIRAKAEGFPFENRRDVKRRQRKREAEARGAPK